MLRPQPSYDLRAHIGNTLKRPQHRTGTGKRRLVVHVDEIEEIQEVRIRDILWGSGNELSTTGGIKPVEGFKEVHLECKISIMYAFRSVLAITSRYPLLHQYRLHLQMFHSPHHY